MNKRFCRRCQSEFAPKQGWSEHFDFNWKKGMVACPLYLGNGIFWKFVKDCPPDNCPYILEHLVSRK